MIANNKASEWSFVDSGVPGSVLVPTLFLCYINDLPHNINHELKLLMMMLNRLPRWIVYWTVNPYKMTSMQYLNGLTNEN